MGLPLNFMRFQNFKLSKFQNPAVQHFNISNIHNSKLKNRKSQIQIFQSKSGHDKTQHLKLRFFMFSILKIIISKQTTSTLQALNNSDFIISEFQTFKISKC